MDNIKDWLIKTGRANHKELILNTKQVYLREIRNLEKDIFATTEYTEEIPLMFKALYDLRVEYANQMDKEEMWDREESENRVYDQMEGYYDGYED